MKKTVLTLILLLFSAAFALQTAGQTYDPRIVVLAPNSFTYEKAFKSEMKRINKDYYVDDVSDEDFNESILLSDFDDEPENIRQIMLSEIYFSRSADFSKYVSIMAHSYITYRLFEYFPDLLVILEDRRSAGELSELESIATASGMQYVLNFPEIKLYKKSGKSFADISVQLYDDITKSLLMNEVFTGDSSNPGFEFACADGSLECTLNNALLEAVYEVLYHIADSNPMMQAQRELAEDRFEELIVGYYHKPFDKSFLDGVVPPSDSTVTRANLYQLLRDPSDTKFVAFFIDEAPAVGMGDFRNYNQDGQVNIISGKDIRDEGFLDDMPSIYAYIVTGVKYEEEWYYKKSQATYFEAADMEDGRQEYFANLADWDFFMEDSTEFNPGFWEGYLFPKIVSAFEENKEEVELYEKKIAAARNEEDAKFYLDIIDRYREDDEKEREYFGLYEIVADRFKKEKREKIKAFTDNLEKEVLEPFYNGYCLERGINGYEKLNKHFVTIFPEDGSVILSPIVFDHGDENSKLHFFVLLPDADGTYGIYKWVYFEPAGVQFRHYGSDVVDHLKQLTKWNFSYDTLEDRDFWENYVLARSDDGSYKYLTPAK